MEEGKKEEKKRRLNESAKVKMSEGVERKSDRLGLHRTKSVRLALAENAPDWRKEGG